MKRKYILPLLLPALLGFSACEKWLNVQPRDKVSEEKLYTTEEGFNSSLNSVYLDMTSKWSYGGQMTMELMEILGHNFSVNTTHQLTMLSAFNYGTDTARARFGMLWREHYKLVANVNLILSAIDERRQVFSDERNYRHMKGEAYGLRAYLHFDLLRLFGPVYATADSVNKSIPYNRAFDTRYTGLLPANEVMDLVLSDLDSAALLLNDDPIIAGGPMYNADPTGGSNFWRMRPLRMNYYAVKGLQARVHLYRNNKPAALAAALSVIEAQAGRFPFVTGTQVSGNRAAPNRVFHTEVLFGLHDMRMNQKQLAYFDAELAPNRILAPNDARLNAIYENNTADYRFSNVIWAVPGNGSKTHRCFYKYDEMERKDSVYRNFLPLIRIAEMYYIAAECDDNPETALAALNTVRKNRGLLDLPPTANLANEIGNEYRREFYGEGQLFFYNKRLFITKMRNGTSATGTVDMTTGKYCPPIPEEEIRYRD